jgi:hypothetical protein
VILVEKREFSASGERGRGGKRKKKKREKR